MVPVKALQITIKQYNVIFIAILIEYIWIFAISNAKEIVSDVLLSDNISQTSRSARVSAFVSCLSDSEIKEYFLQRHWMSKHASYLHRPSLDTWRLEDSRDWSRSTRNWLRRVQLEDLNNLGNQGRENLTTCDLRKCFPGTMHLAIRSLESLSTQIGMCAIGEFT